MKRPVNEAEGDAGRARRSGNSISPSTFQLLGFHPFHAIQHSVAARDEQALFHAEGAHGTVGTGPLYQGRFKSFPIQEDEHFFTVCRYVERNALRVNLVTSVEPWRWSSLWHRINRSAAVTLADWPFRPGQNWLDYVTQAETEAEWKALRRSAYVGSPFASQ